MAVTGKVGIHLNLLDSLSGDVEGAQVNINSVFDWAVANGTGANQANLIWSDTRTLGSGANEDLDVAGSLAGLTGTKVFVKVKAIAIFAAPTNTVNLTVSRPATTGLPFLAADGDAFVLKPGGMFLIVDPSAVGIAVAAGADDVINVLAGAASSVYTIVVVGTNA